MPHAQPFAGRSAVCASSSEAKLAHALSVTVIMDVTSVSLGVKSTEVGPQTRAQLQPCSRRWADSITSTITSMSGVNTTSLA